MSNDSTIHTGSTHAGDGGPYAQYGLPPEPTPPTRPRWRRLLPPALLAGAITAGTIALHFRDPHEEGSWGQCPTAAMGFWCPGCGGLRAVNDLSFARIGDAASSNLFFVALLPLIGYAFWRWTSGAWTGRSWSPSARSLNLAATLIVTAMVVFTILRNTPAGSWLAP